MARWYEFTMAAIMFALAGVNGGFTAYYLAGGTALMGGVSDASSVGWNVGACIFTFGGAFVFLATAIYNKPE